MSFSRRLGITTHKYNLCTSYSYMYVRRCALWPSARFIHRCKIYYRKIHTPKEISRARADPFKVQNEPKSRIGMFELATVCRMVAPSIYGPRMRNSMRIYVWEEIRANTERRSPGFIEWKDYRNGVGYAPALSREEHPATNSKILMGCWFFSSLKSIRKFAQFQRCVMPRFSSSINHVTSGMRQRKRTRKEGETKNEDETEKRIVGTEPSIKASH